MTEGVAVAEAAINRLLSLFPDANEVPREFWAGQFDAGLAWVDFPLGCGGLGLDHAVQEVVRVRLAEVGAPTPVGKNLIGVNMVAPTLVACGSDDQQTRFLRPAFVCDEIWCQLFSEPEAGSDLAGLRTSAVRDGDVWVVNGQKVWTTLAHIADWAILLARTDPDAPKHRGLTMFLVDMSTPGIEVRPLRQITGDAEYNEVFLTEVRIPDSYRVGEAGRGWQVAMSTLTMERSVVGENARGAPMRSLISRLRRSWATADPSRRTSARCDRVVSLLCAAQVTRWTAERADESARRGASGAEASIAKISFSHLSQQALELCVELEGPAGTLIDDYAIRQPTEFTHVGRDEDDQMPSSKMLLATQALTIAGGTTNINKNVLADRVLGLPPEPRPDRDLPWHISRSGTHSPVQPSKEQL